jgi:2-polyprenyl-6-methoxyphenol hydroxylase-like FAD-dependent oxidoreductase
MDRKVAIVGAGVSGLTCGVVLAEHGYRTAIFAKDVGQQTTSSVAAAVWFPYHVEPAERVIPLALETYQVLLDLTGVPDTGVSMIESQQFLRTGEIEVPDWAIPLGAQPVIPSAVEESRGVALKLGPRDPSTALRSAQDDQLVDRLKGSTFQLLRVEPAPLRSAFPRANNSIPPARGLARGYP